MIRFVYAEHQALWNALPHGVQHAAYVAYCKPTELTLEHAFGYLDAALDYLIITHAQHDFIKAMLNMALALVENTTNSGESNHE